MSMSPVYSRIRVTMEQRDVVKLLPLINDYIDHPEHAASVRELVCMTPPDSVLGYCYDQEAEGKSETEREEVSRSVEGEVKLRSALKILGVGEDAEEKWLKHLTCMELDLVAERESGDRRPKAHFSKQAALFTQYAGALLLLMCPNIETLTYEDNGGPAESILRLNNTGHLPGRHLQRLREVRLLHTSDESMDERFFEYMDPLSVLGLFHRLPLLEKLTMAGISPNQDRGYVEDFRPASSSVKRLHLIHVEMPSMVYGALIRASKHLEELTLIEGGRATGDGGFFLRHLTSLALALECHKSTLRKLDLDMVNGWRHYGLDESDDPDVGRGSIADKHHHDTSGQGAEEGTDMRPLWQLEEPDNYCGVLQFQEFKRLTRLSIGIEYLLGPSEAVPSFRDDRAVRAKRQRASVSLLNSLPACLEYLEIRGYKKGKHAHYDAEVDRLLAEMPIQLPSLAEVHGVEEHIMMADWVSNPDENPELLWEPEEVDDDWVEEAQSVQPA